MSITAIAFYTTSGMMFAAALQVATMAVNRSGRTLFLSFALCAVFGAAYQLFTGIYYQSQTLEESLFALRIQTACVPFIMFFFYWFMCLYTESKHHRITLPITAVWCFILLIINSFAPYTIRFNSVEMSVMTLPWGEVIYPLVGETSGISKLFHGTLSVYLLWLIALTVRLFHEKHYRKAVFLCTYTSALVLTIYTARLIDRGEVQFFYPAGFSFVLLVGLMAVNIALDSLSTKKKLGKSMQRSSELEGDNEMLVALFEQLPLSVQLIDAQTTILRDNAARKILGDLNISVGEKLSDSNTYQTTALAESVKAGFSGQFRELDEFAMVHESGKTVWLKFRLFPLKDQQTGAVNQVALIGEEYTSKRAVKNAIVEIAEGVSKGADTGLFEDMVKKLTSLFGAKYAFIAETLPYEEPDYVRTITVCVDGEISENIRYQLAGTPCAKVADQSLCGYPDSVQSHFPTDQLLIDMEVESYLGAPMFDTQGRSRGILVVLDTKPMKDIEQKSAVLEIFAARAGAEIQRLAAEQEVHRLAFEDYITQLPNRSQLHLELKRRFEETNLDENPINLYLLDLDFFKNINDALGHDIGDDVLRAIANRFAHDLPKYLTVYRFGGDEFVFIETELDRPGCSIKSTAETLISSASEVLKMGDHYLSLGASVGCVQIPLHADNELKALRCLELSVYDAKSGGRNGFEIFDPAQIEVSNERFVIRSELKAAINSDEFDLYIQPQLGPDGKVVGGEALVRWLHPQRGFMSPAEFIPIAEESGLIHALGEWVIDKACQYIVSWTQKGIRFGRLSINISAWQVGHPDFESKLLNTIKRYDISTSLLTLEVTESSILRDVHATISIFKRLRRLGFRIALDDFGTGYSSLAYLRDLPLDELKIDRSFVIALEDMRSQALVRSMIAISNNMSLEVVAEGVETERQQHTLAGLGCEIFQGYLFAKPMKEVDYLEWMDRHS